MVIPVEFGTTNNIKISISGCQVQPFGSIVTGLGIRTSDVDCYVQVPDFYEYDQVGFALQARNKLRRYNWIFKKVFAITTAKVPIVKMYHEPTGRNCDISFKNMAGVRNSKMIGLLLQMDKRALGLSILIKYWTKVHSLTGTNLLPNYALTMLIIYYLQYKNILPSVSILQKLTNEQIIVDGWNVAFRENYYHSTDNTESLYELLGGFFQFYSTFKFDEHIISPFLAKSIPRKCFVNLQDVSNELGLYKTMVSREEVEPLKIDTQMCIQDIFEHNKNVTLGVFPRLLLRISIYIKAAAKLYEETDSKQFLREIMLMKPTIPPPTKKKAPQAPNAPKAPVAAHTVETPRNLKRPGNFENPSYKRPRQD